ALDAGSDRTDFPRTMTARPTSSARRWLLPRDASPDAPWLMTARGTRAFADGLVSVLLPTYLLGRGFDAFTVGILSTVTLLGTAALALAAGAVTNRIGYRPLLLASCALMAGTGVGFATLEQFWPLAIVAFVGTLNPSAGDVSVFLPLEQSLLTQMVGPRGRTALFARYSLIGTFAGALGTLSAGLPILIAQALAYPPHRV